jgi:hypothetical protein
MLQAGMNASSLFYILLSICMMPANWLLETRKWHLLLKRDMDIGFIKSLKAVLGGLALSLNTPNRLGEYFGRILYLQKGKRIAGAHYSIISGLSQLLITLIAGFSAIELLPVLSPLNTEKKDLLGFLFLPVSQLVLLITILILIVIYLNYFNIIRWLCNSQLSKRYFFDIQIPDIENNLRFRILFISLMRFMIFTTQYILIWKALGLTFDYIQGAAIVSIIYLVMAIIPTIAIAELGIRGKVALLVAGMYTDQLMSITTGTVFIWLLNIMLPGIMGSFFLWNLKWKEKK